MNYECHITTTVADAGKAEEIAKANGWKTSEIKRDPLLGDGSHFYLTAHHVDYYQMHQKMRTTAELLRAEGCIVLREKIEAIVFDTKTKTNEPFAANEGQAKAWEAVFDLLLAKMKALGIKDTSPFGDTGLEWALGFVEYLYGQAVCQRLSCEIGENEYQGKNIDEFAEAHGGRSKNMAEPEDDGSMWTVGPNPDPTSSNKWAVFDRFGQLHNTAEFKWVAEDTANILNKMLEEQRRIALARKQREFLAAQSRKPV